MLEADHRYAHGGSPEHLVLLRILAQLLRCSSRFAASCSQPSICEESVCESVRHGMGSAFSQSPGMPLASAGPWPPCCVSTAMPEAHAQGPLSPSAVLTVRAPSPVRCAGTAPSLVLDGDYAGAEAQCPSTAVALREHPHPFSASPHPETLLLGGVRWGELIAFSCQDCCGTVLLAMRPGGVPVKCHDMLRGDDRGL